MTSMSITTQTNRRLFGIMQLIETTRRDPRVANIRILACDDPIAEMHLPDTLTR